MQTAFVGIGTVAQSVFVDRGVLSSADLAALRGAGAVGEICGRFYDRDGQECDTDFRGRAINIGLDKLRVIPEVIGVTRGHDRAHAVIAALRGGIIKSLIIDEEGARAMLEAGDHGNNG
jgi:DNA-binding transcriptional regulator LsrR (DeoR family)